MCTVTHPEQRGGRPIKLRSDLSEPRLVAWAMGWSSQRQAWAGFSPALWVGVFLCLTQALHVAATACNFAPNTAVTLTSPCEITGPGTFNFDSLTISTTVTLVQANCQYPTIVVANAMNIDPLGVLTADGQGYAGSNVNGFSSTGAAGGSHAGRGGAGYSANATAGAASDHMAPLTCGAGGGNSAAGSGGGAGGGVIRITVGSGLTVNGTIT